jgi:hypothetical protein
MQSTLFVNNEQLYLTDDTKLIPIEQNCITFVHKKLQTDEKNMCYHPLCTHPEFKESWPRTTTICCWHCGESFTSVPIPIVDTHNTEDNIYRTFGIFCSVNCAKAYLIEHDPYITNERMLMFNHMLQNVFQVSCQSKPAPPRIRLKKYGGDLTLTQFRNHFDFVHNTVLMPPFVPQTLIIYESKKKQIFQTPVTQSKRPSLYEEYIASKKNEVAVLHNGNLSQYVRLST